MPVDTDGTVQLRGEPAPGVPVRVHVEGGHLRIESEKGVVGDWQPGQYGINVLGDGFAIRAEGEEFILRSRDDVAIAEELGVATASPRMARKLAARHNPDRPLPEEAPVPQVKTYVGAVAFALGGAMILLGGAFLRAPVGAVSATGGTGGAEFWFGFVIGGLLMVFAAVILAMGMRVARLVALIVLGAIVVLFGFAVSRAVADVGHLTAYGFIAGGMVVGVTVLFGSTLGSE